MENYSFKQMDQDLDRGFQIYFTYVGNRYLVFKTTHNCYTQELISWHEKNPQPKIAMITHKRLKELYPFMEEIEYKVGI